MLLSISKDSKTVKGEKNGYLTAIMYLSPGSISGKNFCPWASTGCLAGCLYTAGRAKMFKKINDARFNRSRFFVENRDAFLAQLVKEIKAMVRKASKRGMIPAIRLNGTSDLPWESIKIEGKTVFELFPHVQFYDYTKSSRKALAYAVGELPKNYSVTFSRSENNEEQAKLVLAAGGNVAVVFNEIPATWQGFKVINGDETDLRFRDAKNVVVGLKSKGDARKDTSGFFVKIP